MTATALVAQTMGGPIGLAAAGAFAEWRTLSLGGVVNTARDMMTSEQLRLLGVGYLSIQWICVVLTVLVAVITMIWIRFSVSDIEEGRQAEEAAKLLD